MQSQNADMSDYKECSICLDAFTRPRMLPCQHIFCSNCLIRIHISKTNQNHNCNHNQNDNRMFTCPKCREEHFIPDGGVDAFQPMDLLFKNLSNESQKKKKSCEDCEQCPSLQKCGHCNANVCENCFLQHKELFREAERRICQLQKDMSEVHQAPEDGERKAQLARFVKRMQKDTINAEKIFAQKIENMKMRQSHVEGFMSMSIKVFNNLLAPELLYIDQVFELTELLKHDCKKTNQFKKLMNQLSDLETIVKAAKNKNDCFEISFDGEHSSIIIGKKEIQINDQHRVIPVKPPDQGQPVASTSAVGTDAQQGEPAVKRKCPCDTVMLPETGQNVLPTNVDYAEMGNRRAAIIPGQENCPPDSALRAPLGNAYHSARKEIYVADRANGRIMVYDEEGLRNGRVFHPFNDLADVAVNEAFVYVACTRDLFVVSVRPPKSGGWPRVLRGVKAFPGGEFQDLCSVAVRGNTVLVLDRRLGRIITFSANLNLTYLRSFGDYLRDPRALAVSRQGDIYVTGEAGSCVTVVSPDGERLCTFGSLDPDAQTTGIAVDGDGNVCVARRDSDCIDVYGPRFNHLTSIGTSGQGPGQLSHPMGLTLTPTGRLIVSDKNNRRLQIF